VTLRIDARYRDVVQAASACGSKPRFGIQPSRHPCPMPKAKTLKESGVVAILGEQRVASSRRDPLYPAFGSVRDDPLCPRDASISDQTLRSHDVPPLSIPPDHAPLSGRRVDRHAVANQVRHAQMP
jgi:hypothetical protein